MVKTTIVKTQAELDAALVGHTADSGDVICIKGGTMEKPIKLNKYYGWTIHAAANAVVEVSGGAHITAMGKSTICANCENNIRPAVNAKDRSKIYAWGADVVTEGNAYAELYGNSSAIARGKSKVVAHNESTVDATEKSTVFAHGNATVWQYDDASVAAYDDAVVR